ncbi:uncharacterized protein LOC115033079 [Acyrthosiphon pisum]|uniref:Regulatory protein zeste n=1 Tax=Acyrthosiphon pisum TaxID=7029 RepID=A0A8R2JKQ6_ACYPI|nr:uncharacterized protein LOC115033079 [Acyrthosiphon pisum]
MKRISTQSGSQNDDDINVKKSRQGRRNDKQLMFMVDYMVQNPHVATGKFCTLNGRDNLAGSWDDLVSSLNNLRNPGVKEKNVKSWKESWRDLKTKVSKKASNLRHAKRQTGNKTIELQELNELDKKVMGIIGHEYIEGTACPESFPDEVSDSIEELARGNTSILNVVPTSIITETPAETYEYYQDDDAIYDNIEVLEASIMDNPLPTDAASCSQSENQLITNVKKKKNVKLNTQFSTAREVFTNLATINSQQIELITSTLSTIAESNHRLADAMVKMAENDDRRTQMEEKLLDLLSTISSKLN